MDNDRFLRSLWATLKGVVAAAVVLLATVPAARACSFCNAVRSSLTEEIRSSDFAVIAKLVYKPTEEELDAAPLDNPPRVKFDIVTVLHGKEKLGKLDKVEIIFLRNEGPGPLYFVYGFRESATAPPDWSTPQPITTDGAKYLRSILELPQSGAVRLAFFLDYLQSPDKMLADDAYAEFAKAPNADVRDLRPRLDRKQLMAWIQDPNMSRDLVSLYALMLGVCGNSEDADMLEQIIQKPNEPQSRALESLLACYLELRGPDGLGLIDELYLLNDKATRAQKFSAMRALIFEGEESKRIARPKLLESLRHMLRNPDDAEMVIEVLARWHDWTVMDRLAEMFKSVSTQESFVRKPILMYMMACPLPEGKKYFKELGELDEGALKAATLYNPNGAPIPPSATERPKKKAAGSDDQVSRAGTTGGGSMEEGPRRDRTAIAAVTDTSGSGSRNSSSRGTVVATREGNGSRWVVNALMAFAAAGLVISLAVGLRSKLAGPKHEAGR